ncbi:hypothetical protein BVG19_g1761 [[Candida] boidinii]|nr:hypothetical protein BVG19_g1761 [[Candida] boidinii]OWB48776.1 hypothetical protein B5S27_g311 [[Candida] boidinii]
MAKTIKHLEGWQYSLLSEENSNGASSILGNDSTPIRRTRRLRGNASSGGSSNSGLILKRESDELEIRQGSYLLIENTAEDEEFPNIVVVKEISFGTVDFIELKICWFIRQEQLVNKDTEKKNSSDEKEPTEESPKVQYGFKKNEIFITPFVDKIKVDSILDKAIVLSEKNFAEIIIDDSNSDSTFLCRRVSDNTGSYFSNIIAWDDYFDILLKDSDAFYHAMKDLSVKPNIHSRSKSGTPFSSPQKKRGKINYKETDRESDNDQENDNEYRDNINNDQDNDDNADAIDDETSPRKRKYTPRQKKTKRTKSASASANSSPNKKRIDVKPELKMPKLPQVIYKVQIQSDNSDTEINESPSSKQPGFKTTQVLRHAKKKLHTSFKLKTLPCREEQFEQIYTSLESAVEFQNGCCLYVSGTPGTGKTATIREVIKQLSANMLEEKNKKIFNFMEINGLKLMTPQSSYELLWEKLTKQRVSSVHAVTLLEDYFHKKDKRRLPLIVLLDELDQVVTKNQTVMYNFFNWPSYENSKLIVIAVANTMDLPERLLTNKISSRLGLTRIQFPGYTFNQLGTIIKHRLEDLSRVYEGKLVITKDAIEFASRKVASVSGDARRSLLICVRAVEIAEMEFQAKTYEEKEQEDGKYTVTMSHIMKAVTETTTTPIASYLNSLSFMAKNFLIAFLQRKRRTGIAENKLGDVIDELQNQLTITLYNDLRKQLEEEDMNLTDIFYDDNSKLRVSGFSYIVKELEESGLLVRQYVYGERNKLLRLNISDDEILNSFKKDPFLKEIVYRS